MYTNGISYLYDAAMAIASVATNLEEGQADILHASLANIFHVLDTMDARQV